MRVLPLVSICIPTYNRPDYLERAIRSCLAQTYANFEIIITDNSTNTASAERVATIKDPRIRYYKNEGNIGAVGSCNRARSLVTGKYVKFLMDDDLIRPTCLEQTVAAFETNPTVGIVMAPMDLIDETDRRIYPKFYVIRTMQYRYRYQVGDWLIPRRQILKDFLVNDYPCCVPSGLAYRTDCLEDFDAESDFAGDVEMCLRIAAKHDFYYIDQVLSSWRYIPVCHTARLHLEGLPIRVFYYLARRSLSDPEVRKLFADEWQEFVRDSFYFCTCRAVVLNLMAGLRARSPKVIWETIKTVLHEEEHPINFLRLPFFVAREIWISIFPPKLPPARE